MIERLSEIEERLDFSATEGMALITYSSKDTVAKERLTLLRSCAEARRRLHEAGVSDDRIDLIKTSLNLKERFGLDRDQKDRAFKRFRLKSAMAHGAFGATAGLGAGLLVQEGIGIGQTLAGEQRGHTVLETPWAKIFGEKKTIDPDSLRGVFQKGGTITVDNHVGMRFDPTTHTGELFNVRTGQPIAVDAELSIKPNGHIVTKGELSAKFRDLLEDRGFDVDRGPDLSGTKVVQREGTLLDKTTGHETKIPKGAEWLQDRVDPTKWDLVEKGNPNKIIVNDAQFDPTTGKFLGYDAAGSGRVLVNAVETPLQKEFVTGPQAAEELRKLATPIHHQEWYGYDMPESQGNELRLFTFKEGNTVILDMSHMQLGFQSGLNPNPINVQDVIANHESGFAFSLPDMQGAKVWVPDGVDGVWDGQLRLDPNSAAPIALPDGRTVTLGEFSQMVVNQGQVAPLPDGDIATEVFGREEVFNLGLDRRMGFIEAARLVNRDGQNILQTFATIRGASAPQVEIVREFQVAINVAQEVPTKIPTFEISPKGPGEVPPVIPIPWAPRRPLEPVIPPGEIIPPEAPYYSGQTLESMRKWISEDSSRLHPYRRGPKPPESEAEEVWLDMDGKPVERTVEKEREAITKYLDHIRETDPEYYKELERLSEESTMPAMREKCRVAVNIPAWMEGKNIYHALEQYTQQTDKDGNPLSQDLYEINILVNNKKGAVPDETIAEIGRFIADAKKRGRTFHINYVDVEFPEEKARVGHARKVVTDLTLVRSMKRSSQTKPLYVESEDADLLRVDQRTVINLIDALDQNPHLDAVRGVQDRYPPIMMENDLVFLSRRMHDFSELFLRQKKLRPENNPEANFNWHRVITGGWNTGYTAEAYALIGGYSSHKEKGEDLEIGEKISMMRGDGKKPNLDVIGRVYTRSDSSPRRFIGEVLTGKGAYSETFQDQELNELIKNTPAPELMELAAPFARLSAGNSREFGRIINAHYRWVSKLCKDRPVGREVFDSVMFWLGFKKGDYTYTPDNRLIINNWENVKAALEDYRKRHARESKPEEAEEKVKKKEIKKTDEVLDRRVKEFQKDHKVDMSKAKVIESSLDDLKASKDIIEVGKYIICTDKHAGKGESGSEILLGYDKETGEILVFKRVKKEEESEWAHKLKYPDGVLDVEDVIKVELGKDPSLSVYVDKIENDGEVIKAYKLAALDLREYLKPQKQLSPENALIVAIGTAQGLRQLHGAGVIHSDIIDNNILLNKDGTVALTDFHIAGIQGLTGSYARSGFIERYRGIMAPELQNKSGTVSTQSTDTYQATVLLYRLLVGKFPHIGKDKAEILESHKKGRFDIPDSVPDPIKRVLKRGMQPNQADRYQTADELLSDLLDAYDQVTRSTPKEPKKPTPSPKITEAEATIPFEKEEPTEAAKEKPEEIIDLSVGKKFRSETDHSYEIVEVVDKGSGRKSYRVLREDGIKQLWPEGRIREYLGDKRLWPEEAETETAEAEATMEIPKRFEVAEKTELGPHPNNEDSVVADAEHGFVGVFDGVGGEPAGDLASAMVRDEVSKVLRELPDNADKQQVHDAMVKGFQQATSALSQHTQEHPEDTGLQTTGTVVKIFSEGERTFAYLMHAGDSRAYAVRTNGSIVQLSVDDSNVTLAFKGGRLTQEQADEINRALDEAIDPAILSTDARTFYRLRNEVANTFNASGTVPRFSGFELGPHIKYILVTSDGVHDNLRASEIEGICKSIKDTKELVDTLVAKAKEVAGQSRGVNQRAKPDDTTAAAIKLS